jgi:hypothetical protein
MKANETTHTTILVAFIALYSILLVYKANFTLVDDHFLLDTTFLGKFFNLGFDPQHGRFNPFVFQEYHFLSIFCEHPSFLYAFNAFQIVVISIILFLLLDRIIEKRLTITLFIIFFFVQPAFVESYFRLQAGEKNSFFLFLIFIYCYFKLIQQDNYKYLILGLICVNLALYFKEPGFIPVGVLALLNLLLTWKKGSTQRKIFDIGLIISSITFILLYLILVFPHIETRYGVWTLANKVRLKILVKLILSDPFLIIGLPVVLAHRLHQIFLKKARINPLYDPLIISALLYVLVFPVMGVGGYRSTLPAYAFGIFPIVYYSPELFYNLKTNFGFIKLDRLFFLVIFIFFLNSTLVGIQQVTFWKNLSINHQQTINFIAKEINKTENNRRKRIFLRGANRANEVEIYVSLVKYLHYQEGLEYSQFDLNSEDTPNNPFLTFVDPENPLTVFQSTNTDQIRKGDYVLIPPFSSIIPDEEYLQSLEKDYVLLFKTNTRFYISTMGLKSILKYLAIRFDLIEISSKALNQAVDYYFFEKVR